MRTNIIISLSIIVTMMLAMGCTEQPYYDIPYDENGNVIITKISVVTADNVTTANESFTVNGYFPNAKSGDVMTAQVLKRQIPSWDPEGAPQLLPLNGTKKDVTVGSDLRTSVTYTRTEAQLLEVGDVVTIVFSGPSDSGIIQIELKAAN